MQIYKQEDIQKMKSELFTVKSRYADLMLQIFEISKTLKEEKAKEYLHHGVARRLEVIERCIENIFSIFPVERNNLLCREELIDVTINLHAFFVNIFGLLDNLAWVSIHENKLADIIDKKNVGLFKKETKKHLPNKFCQYLDSPKMKLWHNQYLTNYRDALSHRISLYVPPQILNAEQKKQFEQTEQEIINCYKTRDFNAIDKLRKQQVNIGTVCPFFVHDSSESKGVFLHPQIIADFNTIEEIVKKYCEMFFEKS
jgi:hypothetical protein